MTLVWNSGKNEGVKLLVMLALADWSDADGESFPSIPTLAKRVRVTERYVQKLIRELLDEKEIAIVPFGGRNGSNRYILALPYRGCPPVHPPVPQNTGGVSSSSPLGVSPSSPNPSVEPSVDTVHVMEAWNSIKGVIGCRAMTRDRIRALKERSKDPSWVRDWEAALLKIAASSFCRGLVESGREKPWVANIDWFLRPNTLTRVMEGCFDDRAKPANKTTLDLQVYVAPGRTLNRQ